MTLKDYTIRWTSGVYITVTEITCYIESKLGYKILRLAVGNSAVQGDGGLIGPAASHVPDGVASSAQHEQGQVKTLHVLNTLSMTWGTRRGSVLTLGGAKPHTRLSNGARIQFWERPLMVRLKQPSRSPDRESAPHWSTTALGWYISITLAMIWKHHAADYLQQCETHAWLRRASLVTYGFEYGFVRLVVDPIPEWVVHSVVFALPSTNVLQKTGH